MSTTATPKFPEVFVIACIALFGLIMCAAFNATLNWSINNSYGFFFEVEQTVSAPCYPNDLEYKCVWVRRSIRPRRGVELIYQRAVPK